MCNIFSFLFIFLVVVAHKDENTSDFVMKFSKVNESFFCSIQFFISNIFMNVTYATSHVLII